MALATLLPLLVAISGVDALCICGGCPRSDALLGATDPADEHDGDVSPCCKRAAAAARAEAAALADGDRGQGRPGVDGRDCCDDHGISLAPATSGADPTSVDRGAWVAVDLVVAPTPGVAAARPLLAFAAARGPPWPATSTYRSTSRIRI